MKGNHRGEGFLQHPRGPWTREGRAAASAHRGATNRRLCKKKEAINPRPQAVFHRPSKPPASRVDVVSPKRQFGVSGSSLVLQFATFRFVEPTFSPIHAGRTSASIPTQFDPKRNLPVPLTETISRTERSPSSVYNLTVAVVSVLVPVKCFITNLLCFFVFFYL